MAACPAAPVAVGDVTALLAKGTPVFVFAPTVEVSAHCDLPCGIYDPSQARLEAESVKAVAQAASNYDEMGGTLARLNRQVARAGRAANAASGSLASLRSASASVDRQIAELTSGMPRPTRIPKTNIQVSAMNRHKP